MYCSHFMTGYGSGAVYATEQGIVKVEIPNLSQPETAQQQVLPGVGPSELTIRVARMLQRYFHGERIDFSDVPVSLDRLPPFWSRTLNVIRTLSYGEVCSYGQVARECGSPRAARAVGSALASNPVPVIIPCHRVVASNGCLTGYSAPGGEGTKRALLKMEGVEFSGLQVVTNQLFMHRIPGR